MIVRLFNVVNQECVQKCKAYFVKLIKILKKTILSHFQCIINNAKGEYIRMIYIIEKYP